MWFVMMPPVRVHNLSADAHGRWKFSRHDADEMYIQAFAPNGYTEFEHASTYEVGPIKGGHYSKTNVVLRLRKVEPAQQ